MATLTAHVQKLPPILKEKYQDPFWVDVANEILERISSEQMMRELSYVRGVVVDRQKFITPPSNYRAASKLCSSTDDNVDYRFIESDGDIILADTFDAETDAESAGALSAFAIDAITVGVSDAEEDEFANYLFKVKTGTLAGETVIVAGNDASSGGTTRIYFAHPTTSLFTITKAATAEFIQPSYWLKLIYRGNYTSITSISQEIPILDAFELRIMKAGLMAYGYDRLYGPGSEKGKAYEGRFEMEIMRCRDEMLRATINSRPKSRVWAGLVEDNYLEGVEYEHGK